MHSFLSPTSAVNTGETCLQAFASELLENMFPLYYMSDFRDMLSVFKPSSTDWRVARCGKINVR